VAGALLDHPSGGAQPAVAPGVEEPVALEAA
jgi:hypothetical protein